jgi:hypothetical protein
MRQDAFEARYSPAWTEFENWLLVEASGKPVAGREVFLTSQLPYRYRP